MANRTRCRAIKHVIRDKISNHNPRNATIPSAVCLTRRIAPLVTGYPGHVVSLMEKNALGFHKGVKKYALLLHWDIIILEGMVKR